MAQTDSYTPGQLASGWHRMQTTGSIKLSDIVRALELEKQLTQCMPLVGDPAPFRPVCVAQAPRPLRSAKRIHLERHTETIAPVPARETGPCLPVDAYGRPYLKVVDFFAYTYDLVVEAVRCFHQLSKGYPTVILLSASRYRSMTDSYFLARPGVRIPYDCENSNDYDVLLRREW